MIDGLALGETTPGPLIMVVAFVGFVGGWTQELFGPDRLAVAGIAGATVATIFTFLPSFLFILVGAPVVERTRDELAFTAPLTAITASVVGVILNLAVFFAYHVLWPNGFAVAPEWSNIAGFISGLGDGFEWFSALIAVAAFFALWRLKVGIIPVIAASALVGVVWNGAW
jgi:chromate transporter